MSSIDRCACGAKGSWDHAVIGSSEGESVRWRGCPYHPTTAVGMPVPTYVFERGRGAIAQYEMQRSQRWAREERAARAKRVEDAIAAATIVGHLVGTDTPVYRLEEGRITTRARLTEELS